VLGVAPGLRSLAYSVVGFYEPDDRGDLIDADVLRGTKAGPDANWAALLLKGRPHRLIMSVVFERNPPAALALGPPYSKKEPDLHVQSVRTLLQVMAQALKVPTLEYADKKTLLSVFPQTETLRNIVLRHVRAESLEGNTALLVATATAAAGALELRQALVSRATEGEKA